MREKLKMGAAAAPIGSGTGKQQFVLDIIVVFGVKIFRSFIGSIAPHYITLFCRKQEQAQQKLCCA